MLQQVNDLHDKTFMKETILCIHYQIKIVHTILFTEEHEADEIIG